MSNLQALWKSEMKHILHLQVSFGLTDPLNPGNGYQIMICNGLTGETILFTGNHPTTKEVLRSPRDCVKVLELYLDNAA